MKGRRGATTTYNQKKADEICSRLEQGETLTSICRDDHMPAVRTVSDWKREHKAFAAAFARARELGFDAIAEEALQIANTPVIGEETEDDGEKLKTKRADMLGHRKLQVWTRLQLLAKWCPARYGERKSVDLNVNETLAERLARARSRTKD